MIRVIAITTGDLFARGEELTGPMQLMFVFFCECVLHFNNVQWFNVNQCECRFSVYTLGLACLPIT